MEGVAHHRKLVRLVRSGYSWYEDAQDGPGSEASVDGEGDASGAGLTSHF